MAKVVHLNSVLIKKRYIIIMIFFFSDFEHVISHHIQHDDFAAALDVLTKQVGNWFICSIPLNSLSLRHIHVRQIRGVARIFQRGVTLGQTISSWRFRHGILLFV